MGDGCRRDQGIAPLRAQNIRFRLKVRDYAMIEKLRLRGNWK